jgi:hypothetical protein
MAIPWLIGIGLTGLAAYALFDDEEEKSKKKRKKARKRARKLEREAQRQREYALQAQRAKEERQRQESIRQKTSSLIYKYNIDSINVSDMAYLAARNQNQAKIKFQAAYEDSSDSKRLSNQINSLNAELAQIKQLSSSLV